MGSSAHSPAANRTTATVLFSGSWDFWRVKVKLADFIFSRRADDGENWKNFTGFWPAGKTFSVWFLSSCSGSLSKTFTSTWESEGWDAVSI